MRGGKIALGVAGLSMGLLLGELLLRWLSPQVYRRPRVWQYDAELGWSHIPGAWGWMETPEFSVEVRINAEGLRDREYAREKEEGTWRLLVFGDSFAEGWGVAVEDAVSEKLEQCLEERQGKVEVLNFGVAGYGTDQELLFFEKLGRRYSPDQVLVFFYPNDLWNNASDKGIGAERGYKPYFRPQGDGRLALGGVPVRRTAHWDQEQRRVDWYFARHWHLYALAQKVLRPEIPRGQQQQFYEGLYGQDPQGRWQPAWELTGRLLRAFKESAERQGAGLVVVYAPAIVQVEEEDWRAKEELYGLVGQFDLEKPNRQIAGFAARHELRLIDLYPAFREAARQKRLFFRDSHWNEAGHALAAEELCAQLEGGGP